MVENQTVVGIIHNKKDTIDIIQTVSENFGFSVAFKKLSDVYKDPAFPQEYLKFVRSFHPDLIVFGVPRPYRKNWQCVEQLLSLDESGDRQFLVTTTSRKEVEKLASGFVALQVLEEPLDITNLAFAMNRCFTASRSGQSKNPRPFTPGP